MNTVILLQKYLRKHETLLSENQHSVQNKIKYNKTKYVVTQSFLTRISEKMPFFTMGITEKDNFKLRQSQNKKFG